MRTLLIVTVCLLGQVVFAQKNSAFLELGGNGGIASLNYEWQLTNSPGLTFRLGAGVSLFGFEKDQPDVDVPGCALCGVDIPGPETTVMTLPISVQYLFDIRNNKYLEAGLGTTWYINDRAIFVHHASFGFRQNFGKDKKWMWRINLTPILGVSGENAIKDSEPTLWGGVSIGRRF